MLLPYFVQKSWGHEYWFANVQDGKVDYCGKLLYVQKDKWSSNFKFHYHKIKDETFFVLEGQLHIDYYTDDFQPRSITLLPLQTFRIKPGMKHRFTAANDTGCKFIEVSTFHSDDDSYICEYDTETGLWKE